MKFVFELVNIVIIYFDMKLLLEAAKGVESRYVKELVDKVFL